MSKKASADVLVFGLALLALGTVFLLENFGVELHLLSVVAKWWPLILILFGALKIKRALQERSERDASS
ncbi:MAG: DUF5668 domain-containing protein [Acidobacteriota bacterium]